MKSIQHKTKESIKTRHFTSIMSGFSFILPLGESLLRVLPWGSRPQASELVIADKHDRLNLKRDFFPFHKERRGKKFCITARLYNLQKAQGLFSIKPLSKGCMTPAQRSCDGGVSLAMRGAH